MQYVHLSIVAYWMRIIKSTSLMYSRYYPLPEDMLRQRCSPDSFCDYYEIFVKVLVLKFIYFILFTIQLQKDVGPDYRSIHLETCREPHTYTCSSCFTSYIYSIVANVHLICTCMHILYNVVRTYVRS